MNKLYNSGFRFIPTCNKEPMLINGIRMGATSATRDKEEIAVWIRANFDIGCVGGKIEGSDLYLVIIDVDVKKEDGNYTLEQLEKEYGKLPETLTVKTPSGGHHYYYLTTEEIGSSVDSFHEKFSKPSGIDIKGRNGYVQCPPTKGYEFVKEIAPARLPVEWQLLLKSLVKCQRTLRQTYSIPRDARLVTDFNKKNPIQETLKEFGYVQAGEHYFQHPYGSTTPRNVVLLKNNNFFKNGSEYVSFHFGAHDKIKDGPHDSWDIHRLLAYGGSHDLMANNYKSDGDGSRWFSSICGAGEIQTTMGDELTEYHWRHGDILTITGDSARYKTFYIIDAAFCLATGLPFLDKFDVREPAVQSVLFLSESARDFADRRQAWIKARSEAYKMDERDLFDRINRNVFVTFKCLPVCGPEAEGRYNAMKPNKLFEPRMLFLDHYSSHFSANNGKDENSNSEAAGFVGALKELADRENVAVAMIHHPPKAKTSTFRGAGALFNNVPVSYDLKATKLNPTWTVVEQIKCSYGKGTPSYHVEPIVQDLYMDKTTVHPRMRTGLTLTYSDTPVDPTNPTAANKGGRPEKIAAHDLVDMMDEGLPYNLKDLQKLFPDVSGQTLRNKAAEAVAKGALEAIGSGKWKVVSNFDLDN